MAVALTRITDLNGFYEFDNLAPGTYALTEQQQPAGYDDGLDSVGNLGGTESNDLLSNIILLSGSAGTEYNFGELEQTARFAEPPADEAVPDTEAFDAFFASLAS